MTLQTRHRTFAERRDLKPGEIFLWAEHFHVVLVVVDARNEVDFWRGGRWVLGEVGPGLLVEVLS